jgi:hypothetical protein
VVWVGAGLGLLWVVLPILMYRLGRTTIRAEISAGPEHAQPRGFDPSYARAYQAFTALGFQPVGTVVETTWFLTPMNWRKQFPKARWLVSPDGRTFLACYRVLALQNVRFALYTMNDRGGIVVTASPGARVSIDPGGGDRRIEVPRMEAAALVARHEAEVAAFCQDRGWSAVPAAFSEVVDRAVNVDRRIARKVVGITFSIFPLACIVLPLLSAGKGSLASSHPALAILSGVVSFAFFRLVAVPIGAITVAVIQFLEGTFSGNR